MIRMFTSCLVLIACWLGCAPLKADENSLKPLVIGVPAHATAIVKEYTRAITQVYEQLGYEVHLHTAPARRMLVEADRGKLDGVILVPSIIEQHFPHLRRIDVPMASIDMVVLSHPSIPDIQSVDDLGRYRIGYLMGYETADTVLRDMHATPVRNYNLLFKMVMKDRLDVILALRRESYRFVTEHPEFSQLKLHPKPLYDIKLYHYVNDKHALLEKQITRILEQKWASGELQQRVRALTPPSPFTPTKPIGSLNQ